MLPSAPLVITIVVGGAGFTKRSVTHSTASSRSTNGTSVSAASRHETPEMRKRGTNTMGLATLWWNRHGATRGSGFFGDWRAASEAVFGKRPVSAGFQEACPLRARNGEGLAQRCFDEPCGGAFFREDEGLQAEEFRREQRSPCVSRCASAASR